MKSDVDVVKIEMLSIHKDLQDMEMSMDNIYLWMGRLEDWLYVLPEISHWIKTYSSQSQSAFLEVNNIQTQLLNMNSSLLVKFERNNTIIDKKFIYLDEELEKVVGLVGEKFEVKLGEFSDQFLGTMEIEDGRQVALEERVSSLEGIAALLSTLLTSVQTYVQELEDAVMEELDATGDVDPDSFSSSSTDVELVENLVVIPAPAPSVIHTLVLVNTPEDSFPQLFLVCLLYTSRIGMRIWCMMGYQSTG